MNFKTTVEREKEELNEEFIDIIQKFAPNYVAHLADSDDNDGENFRQSINEAFDNVGLAAKQEQTEMFVKHTEEILKTTTNPQELVDWLAFYLTTLKASLTTKE